MLAIKNETCILQLPSGLTNFRITIVKPYLQKSLNTITSVLHDLDTPEFNLDHSANEVTNSDSDNDIDATKLSHRNLARIHYLPTRFQNIADISVFLKNNNTSQFSFTES